MTMNKKWLFLGTAKGSSRHLDLSVEVGEAGMEVGEAEMEVGEAEMEVEEAEMEVGEAEMEVEEMEVGEAESHTAPRDKNCIVQPGAVRHRPGRLGHLCTRLSLQGK